MKNLKNLGKVLNSKEQKSINGGGVPSGIVITVGFDPAKGCKQGTPEYEQCVCELFHGQWIGDVCITNIHDL